MQVREIADVVGRHRCRVSVGLPTATCDHAGALTLQGIDVDTKTKFVRIAIGGGVKF
jgi:hypothetical protein